MSTKPVDHKSIVAALIATVTISCPDLASSQSIGSSPAETVLMDLRGLGEVELLTALPTANARDAQRIARELDRLWDRSGSAAMDLLLRRGRDALERGETTVALGHFTALTDHAPGFARGWSERGRVFFISGRVGPAVADLERALALNPQDYDAIFALGQLWEFFQNPQRAHAAYLRAKAIHPHHEEVTKALDRLSDEALGKPL